MKSDKKAILIGGGIGIPPMLQLAKELDCEKSVVLGYRDEIFLNEEFEPYAQVYMSSEDGQHGVKGNVIDAIKEYGVDGAVIYACGPTPMLRGIKAYAMEKGISARYPWRRRWRAAWAHVLPAYARQRILMSIHRCTTEGSVRMDLYSTLRRWSCNVR